MTSSSKTQDSTVFSNKFILNFLLHSFSPVHLRCCACSTGRHSGHGVATTMPAPSYRATCAVLLDHLLIDRSRRRVHACCERVWQCWLLCAL